MINGTTSSGFEFHVPKGLKNDARFVRAIAALNNDDLSNVVRTNALFDAITALFSNYTEEERFYKHLASKNESGRATTEAVSAEITEIINYCKEHDPGIKKS